MSVSAEEVRHKLASKVKSFMILLESGPQEIGQLLCNVFPGYRGLKDDPKNGYTVFMTCPLQVKKQKNLHNMQFLLDPDYNLLAVKINPNFTRSSDPVQKRNFLEWANDNLQLDWEKVPTFVCSDQSDQSKLLQALYVQLEKTFNLLDSAKFTNSECKAIKCLLRLPVANVNQANLNQSIELKHNDEHNAIVFSKQRPNYHNALLREIKQALPVKQHNHQLYQSCEKKDYHRALRIASTGSIKLVTILLSYAKHLNIDVNKQAEKGDRDSALHHAARRNHVDIYNMLVKHGAKENLLNEKGEKPVDLLKKHQNKSRGKKIK